MSDILKTTSYHIDDDNGLMLSKRGSLWAISVDTTDGVIEVEMTAKAACAVREFFADATCDACKAAPEPQPAPEPEPVVALGRAQGISGGRPERREEGHR